MWKVAAHACDQAYYAKPMIETFLAAPHAIARKRIARAFVTTWSRAEVAIVVCLILPLIFYFSPTTPMLSLIHI